MIQDWPWLRVSPPIIAIALAIIFREVNFALLLAMFSGCLLLHDLSWTSSVTTFCDVLVGQVADADHASVILFTVLLGAMIGVMNDSGGTKAVVDRLATFADTRRKGQILTWLAGLVVFFDDYANTMLIGGSMRPLADKLKISRAKLAFLIDATAAPVAGLALSTWTAFEIGQVQAGLQQAGIDASAQSVFLATIPFRIYPLLAIVAVAAFAICGRDFGPMLKAEQAAADAVESETAETSPEHAQSRGIALFAVLPIAMLVAVVWNGYSPDVDAYRLLLTASLASATTAAVLPWLFRRMTLAECSSSWVSGITSMIPAIVVLVLAWAISDVCRPGKLDTAGYIVSLIGDSVRPEFLPTVAFAAAGAIAVAIGSSFTTMSLLLPIFIPLTWTLISAAAPQTTVDDPLFLATIGAILAGAIFGDHCSPISDTTVLSSAAAGCDHLQHVATQLPYAMVVAVCSILFGYLPIGFGVPWWIALPLSAATCVSIILFLGTEPTSRSASDVAAGDIR
ncbi:MAG: Na+/H+ antiporter NhaC family protein [Planctomycetaceae bacterium]